MSISASEAARLTGKRKQTIINAIQSGKISAVKHVDGSWQIEPVELFRHYSPLPSLDGPSSPVLDGQLDDTWQVENKLLRELLGAHEATIADLRERLDTATAQVGQLSAVIAQLSPPKAKPGWWARLLGGA